MWPNPDLVTFTKKILDIKLHFFVQCLVNFDCNPETYSLHDNSYTAENIFMNNFILEERAYRKLPLIRPPNMPHQICNPLNIMIISPPYMRPLEYKPTSTNFGSINVDVIHTEMVNYWYEDLHLTCFRESWKRHCSLSLLLLFQINVILAICDC